MLDALRADVGASTQHFEAIEWVLQNAPNRAEKLRASAAFLSGTIGPSVESDINAEADAIDAITKHRTEREWDLDRATLTIAIDRVRASCGDQAWPEPRAQLAPDAIAIVTRASASKMRSCYEASLADIPALEGKVVASFSIEPDGSASTVEDAGSDLPAKDAVKCVLDVFRALRFPAPRRGSLKVVYPIVFNRGT